ncbi:hypothetical protein [Paenibacillus peoriae]|uniref:hypothetical protein n=1 Tax=Paenibacillus peoriae TaxID=59893 RepID=UPI00215AB360|nr:hypothetical protein [Paenibacillus peoriae]
MNEQQRNDRQGRVGEQNRPEHEIRQVERELGALYPKGRSRIALTGASGYIGHNLLQRLTEHADVIALSRSGDQRENTEQVEWRSCDFFSMEDANQGLQGADYAVYLIHSMLPSAKLTLRRLPVMVLPRWTRTKTHPIALEDILNALDRSIGNRTLDEQIIDVGGPEVMTYREMMQRTAEIMDKKRRFFNVPLLTIKLSRLWVTLVTGAPKEMAYPLIESLAHPMVAQRKHKVQGISDGKISFDKAARTSLEQEEEYRHKKNSHSKSKKPLKSAIRSLKSDVRSVQRIKLPPGKDATWAGERYLAWLPVFAKHWVRVETRGPDTYQLYLLGSRKPLLEMIYDRAQSTSEFALYRITGGTFATVKEDHRGRLEFLQIPGTNICVVAIHDYVPSLPWFIYKYTQAKVHLGVMYAFGKYVKRLIDTNV